MRTLAELQAECAALGITVNTCGRASKEPYVTALRDHHWRNEHPGEPLPPQIEPMLLGKWEDLDPTLAEAIEQDGSGWIVQPKLDGVRALLHVEAGSVRITGRCVSDVTYRLGEFQDNLPHLTNGLSQLAGTILDGELLCPVTRLDTGGTITADPLQAACAILATSPDNARRIQERHHARLRFHAFDILRHQATDTTAGPLQQRQALLAEALTQIENPFLRSVPTHCVDKAALHQRILSEGGEGTVWKQENRPYEPGRRVKHWIKRKAAVAAEAIVTNWKPGNPERGHARSVGALEFSSRQADGSIHPVAWVSSWSDAERQAMTQYTPEGQLQLNPAYQSRRARIVGHDHSAKAHRFRHARFVQWLDG